MEGYIRSITQFMTVCAPANAADHMELYFTSKQPRQRIADIGGANEILARFNCADGYDLNFVRITGALEAVRERHAEYISYMRSIGHDYRVRMAVRSQFLCGIDRICQEKTKLLHRDGKHWRHIKLCGAVEIGSASQEEEIVYVENSPVAQQRKEGRWGEAWKYIDVGRIYNGVRRQPDHLPSDNAEPIFGCLIGSNRKWRQRDVVELFDCYSFNPADMSSNVGIVDVDSRYAWHVLLSVQSVEGPEAASATLRAGRLKPIVFDARPS